MSRSVLRTTSDDPKFLELVEELTAFTLEMDGEELHAQLSKHNTVDSISYAVVVLEDDTPIGCGGLRPYSDSEIEVKRVFVRPQARRSGAAVALMSELESWARELGFEKVILETSIEFHPALALYKSLGYIQTEKYDPYKNVHLSICFAKTLQ